MNQAVFNLANWAMDTARFQKAITSAQLRTEGGAKAPAQGGLQVDKNPHQKLTPQPLPEDDED